MLSSLGKILIITGVIIVLAGIVLYFFGNKLHFLGRLPGDIRIEKENVKIFFPITTMIILSLIITVIINIIKRFFH
jgi:hypothetical protein